MSVATILKLVAWGVIVAVVLQVIFYFVFQIMGYDSYLLSITLIISVVIGILLLFGWRTMKKQRNSHLIKSKKPIIVGLNFNLSLLLAC